MTSPSRRVYERAPSTVPAWVRGVTQARKPQGTLPTEPTQHLELLPQKADPQLLARYRRLCGFVDSPWLPLTFPQVMASPLHLIMVTDPQFPVPALGLVHVANRIEQRLPIRVDDALHLACHFEPARQTSRGIEFDLVTQASVHSEVAWRSVFTMLARRPTQSEAVPPQGPPQDGQLPDQGPQQAAQRALLRSTLLRVPEDTGRRYAAISGDLNPIHLHAATARLFGFPKAIAHGMWSLARTLAECEDDLPRSPLVVEARFRKPILLPAKLLLTAQREPLGLRMELRSTDASRSHLSVFASPYTTGPRNSP